MKSAPRLLRLSAASLIHFAGLSGCAQPESLVPVTDLRPWRPIGSSCKDTAQTREEIRAHNGVYQSLKTGKKTVYVDDCPADPTSKPTS